MASGTIFSGHIIHDYGNSSPPYYSHLAIDLSYSGYRVNNSSKMHYDVWGSIYIVKDNGGTSNYGYSTQVLIYLNGDWQGQVVSDNTFTSTLQYYSGAAQNSWTFSGSKEIDITSGTMPLTIEVKDTGGVSTHVNWADNSIRLAIDPVLYAPSYNSISATNITAHIVSLSASINNGGATISDGGWKLSTDGGSTWTTYSGGPTSKNITGLTRNTTYSYKGYATNSVGTTESSVGTFTTLAEEPTVVISGIGNITETSAEILATCTDDGGSPIVDSFMYVSRDNTFATIDATINGLFGTASGLLPNTVYYVQAKVANIQYGGTSATSTFTTLAPSGLDLYVSEDKRIIPSQITHIDISDITYKAYQGFDLDFRYEDVLPPNNSYKHLIGMGGGGTNTVFNLCIRKNANNETLLSLSVKRSTSTNAATINYAITDNDTYKRHLIQWRVDSNGVGTLRLDGIIIDTLSEIDITYTNTKTLCLLNNADLWSQGDTRGAFSSIFSFKYYEYDVLTHELIPYEDSGVAYLRDITPATPVNYTASYLTYKNGNFNKKDVFLSENGGSFTDVTNYIKVSENGGSF